MTIMNLRPQKVITTGQRCILVRFSTNKWTDTATYRDAKTYLKRLNHVHKLPKRC